MSSVKQRSGSISAPFKKPRKATQTKMTGYNFLPTRVSAKGELKDKTTQFTNRIVAAQTTATTASTLMTMAQGTAATERVGRRIVMKSLWVRWVLSMAATSAGNSGVRILIVYDKQTNGAAAATTDVVDTDVIQSFKNLGNERRFITLMDEHIECLGTQGPQSVFGQRYIKMNLPAEFNSGTTGAISDVQTGSLLMFVWQNGNIITAGPLSTIITRVRFSDS